MKKRNLLLLAAITFGMGNLWALDQVDGVYQIGSAQDFKDFAAIVNSDGRSQDRNAVVTADFTLDDNTMIGAPSNAYRGTFDGKGHTITVAYNIEKTGQDGECGVFRRVNGGTVKNLIVRGDINTKGQLAGGVVSGIWQVATIENCVSYVTITDTQSGDGTHGGIVARISDKSNIVIRNCAFFGTINAPGRTGSGGILGWPDNASTQVRIENCLMAGTLNLATGQDNDVIVRNTASVSNCYYFDLQGMNNSKSASQATSAQAASGELCFLLNGSQSVDNNWFQDLSSETMPSPIGTAVVYANGDLNCDGTPKGSVNYSNTEGAGNRDPHTWGEWGFCTVCDEFQPDFLVADENGFYPIATKQDYNWYMVLVNQKGNGHTNAKLTADLDLGDYAFVPLGVDGSKFTGTFDGQGHRIKNMTIDGTKKEQGFFSVCGGGAVIKNLVIDSSCRMNGTGGANVAALIGCVNGNDYGTTITIQNVGNEMSMTVSTTNNAGFVARDFSNYLRIVFENCYNTGDIYGGVENGAFTAWTPRVTLTNCWNTGRIEQTGGYDGSKSLARGNGPTFINSYDLNTANSDNAGQPTGYEASWLASGKFCYFLNGNSSEDVSWFQKLGEDADAHPYPFGTNVVYANGDVQCDGVTPKEGSTIAYSNTAGAGNRDPHTWGEWGFCTVCDEINPDFLTPTDNVYALATDKQLNWFAVYTQRVDASVNAKLTANIDMAAIENFPGIGSNEKNYTGTFDGQRHILSNVKMEFAREGVGFINRAANGAHLKNVTLASNSSFKGSKAVAGLIGGLYGGGDVYIDNCGNEASVVSTGQNAGGVIGVCFNGTIAHLTNVYNVGTIKGNDANESGSLSGWMTNAVLVNCYSVAGYPTAEDTHGFVEGKQFGRGDGIKLTNCYDYGTGDWGTNNGTWGVFTKISNPADELEMGKAFAGLFDGEGGNVWRMEFNGWAHPVLYDTDIVLKENFPNRIVAAENADVTFYRTTVADVWNTFAAPVALTAEQVEEVFGTGAKVAALKEIAGEVATFETVTATEAGKAYLVMPTAAKTTFALKADLSDAAPATADFQGVYTPTELTANDLFVATGNTLQAAKSGSLKAFRAYFKNAAASGAKFFTVDGEANGIIGLNGEVMTAKEVYNLNGQRVNAAQKGVYIVNGKKVVM
ncbi:MAG: hypothetical protein IJR71_07555 [Prevotella sp.]|nr:hypothetical protein [Prevotella sp.]